MSLRRTLFKQYRTPRKKEFANRLRINATKAEKLLLKEFRKPRNDANYLRVHFQKIILGFIVDFYFSRARLIVEIDGSYHDSEQQNDYDQRRAKAFENHGFKVIRFTNQQVYTELDSVIKEIRKWYKLRYTPYHKPKWLKKLIIRNYQIRSYKNRQPQITNQR